MIKHIVLFKFHEENKEQNIQKAKEMLSVLPNVISELKGIEIGINFDSAPRAMDMSIYTTFDSVEDLNSYAVDPEHLKVVEFIKQVTEYSKVSDYVI